MNKLEEPRPDNEFEDTESLHLARLMADFQPHPGPCFYQRMAAAPWNAPRRRVSLLRILAASALSLVLIAAAAAAYPPLQASATRLLNFFSSSPTASLELEFVVPDPAKNNLEQGIILSDFPLSLAEAEALAGYPVRRLSEIPAGFQLAGADYDPKLQGITLQYRAAGQMILLYQRPIALVHESSRIGPNTAVQKVQVRNTDGELVRGGWRLSSGSQLLEDSPPGTPVSLKIYWDANYPQLTLRWQDTDMAYELSAPTNGEIDSDFLIQLANTIE